MAAETGGSRRGYVLRHPRRNVGHIVLGAWGTILWFGGVVSVVANRPDDSDRWIPIATVFVIAGLAWVVGSVRTLRVGVRIVEGGVRIANPLRTYSLRWEEIDDFSLEPHGRHPCVGVARLRDGREIEILGIRPRHGLVWSHTEPGQRLVDELNDLLHVRRVTRQRTGVDVF